MLEDRYFRYFYIKISRIHMMLQTLFPEFLTTHIYLDTNLCSKLLMLLPQNQVDLPSEQLSIVFPTLSILRRDLREWVDHLSIRGKFPRSYNFFPLSSFQSLMEQKHASCGSWSHIY